MVSGKHIPMGYMYIWIMNQLKGGAPSYKVVYNRIKP